MTFPSLAANVALARQAIKTAIAGVACLYITQLLNLPEGYWAAISALIVMQSSVGATVSASRTRLAGTAVGALIGGAFFARFGTSIPWFAVAAALSFYVCSVLNLAESQRLATVTVAIVMLIGHVEAPWTIAWHRFLEVAIGILIALVVSMVLWPSRARRSVRQGVADTFLDLNALFRSVSHGYRNGQPADSGVSKSAVDTDMRRNKDLLEHAIQETVGLTRGPEVLEHLMERTGGVVQAVESLELAVHGGASDTYVQSFAPELDRLESDFSDAFQWLAENAAKKATRKAGRTWPPPLPA